jgi:hypothetical protein
MQYNARVLTQLNAKIEAAQLNAKIVAEVLGDLLRHESTRALKDTKTSC